MYVFLTIKTNHDLWTWTTQKSNTINSVFTLLADRVTLALLFFLAAFAVEDMAFSNSFCCLSVNSFLFCPIFSKLCIAWSHLVSAVWRIIVATLTICMLTAVPERASCRFDVALLIDSSAAFKSAFTTSSSGIGVSSLSWRECLDLAISFLAFCILLASLFCSAYSLFFSSSSFSAFSHACYAGARAWADHTHLFNSSVIAMFSGWPLTGS